jgi:hypothetical protein
MVQRNVFLALATGFLLFSSEIALPVPKKFPQLVPEIPDFNLQDFAEVKVVRGRGPVIVFNPVVCAQAGRALCQFSRWHEYGHIVLGHPLRRIKPERMEIEADQWAAQNAGSGIGRVPVLHVGWRGLAGAWSRQAACRPPGAVSAG